MIGYEHNPRPRECNYSEKLDYFAREISSLINEDGYACISIDGRYHRLTIQDFNLHVEENQLQKEVLLDRDTIFNNWCESYAPYRIAYVEE